MPLTQEGVNLFREMEHELFAANAELDAIRAVFQHGADEENWKPGTSLAEAVAKLKVAAGIPNDEDQRRRDREASSATET